MSTKKILAVMGATGAQGGGLVRAVLDDPRSAYAVRAITRDPNAKGAQELAKRGAEVVAGHLDDPASIERAFQGADAAYCVTFYWAHMDPKKETAHGETLARAAHKAGVGHAIWSTFEDTRKWVPLDDDRMPTLNGNYKVPHFDAKADADHVFRDLNVPTTFLYTSAYWDNFIYFGWGPKRGPDGALALTFPMGDKKLPAMAAEDIGKCAYGIFKAGGEFIGKTIGVAGEHLTGSQMAASLTKALGENVRYNAVEPDVYRGFGFPGADDVGNMFQFKRDFQEDYLKVRDLALSRRLNPALMTLDAWLVGNASRIPLD
jgi:uncharacterized protein YbjT (DUF2867 family)